MCGIAGGVGLTDKARPSQDVVSALTAAVAHRGPDSQGLWVSPSGQAVLGHRRLSIIDLAAGQQPMTSPDASKCLVFNGEIYNYVEQRRELERAGVSFRTQSDTEVLHLLLQSRGTDALSALRGMFAFAAWDDDARTLTVARDRIGKKPFFYRIVDDVLYFASSLRALRSVLPAAWEVDPNALDLYLTLGFIPAPTTIYRDTWKLPAAHVGTLTRRGLETQRYWSLADQFVPYAGSYDDALRDLEAQLAEAVRLRLRSDVPLGVYLSGGIDSSLIASFAAREATAALETFSIGFGDRDFDETQRAAEVAARIGLRHHIFPSDSSISSALPQLAAHFGEPNADWSALPMWLLAEKTRKHVTVALGGDGGDEGFAGYPWYRTAARLARIRTAVPPALAGIALDALRHSSIADRGPLGRVQRGLEALSVQDDADRFAMLRTLFGRRDRSRLYTPELAGVLQPHMPTHAAPAAAYRSAGGSELRRMRYADQQLYLADNLMPKVDVTSMAFGLEVRAPLLDQELVAFGLSLPDAYVCDESGGKRILRDLLARTVPGLRTNGPKRGFTPPVANWLKGELRHAVNEMPGAALVRDGWLQRKGVGDLVREHLSGQRDHGARLYALLMLDEWLRLDRPDTQPEPGDRLAAAE